MAAHLHQRKSVSANEQVDEANQAGPTESAPENSVQPAADVGAATSTPALDMASSTLGNGDQGIEEEEGGVDSTPSTSANASGAAGSADGGDDQGDQGDPAGGATGRTETSGSPAGGDDTAGGDADGEAGSGGSGATVHLTENPTGSEPEGEASGGGPSNDAFEAAGSADPAGGGAGSGGAGGGSAGGAGSTAEAGPSLAAASLGGNSSTEVINNFAGFGASQQAATLNTLGGTLGTAAEATHTAFKEGLPDVEIEINTSHDPAAAESIEKSPSGDSLGQGTSGPTPKADIAPTDTPAKAPTPSFSSMFAGISDEEGSETEKARAVGKAISAIWTSDPNLRTTPGKAPKTPLTGKTDPAQVTAEESAAGTESATALADSAQKIDAMPGRERVPELEVSEVLDAKAGLKDLPKTEDVEVPSEVQYFLDLPLDAQVIGQYDAMYSPELQASLGEAQEKIGSGEDDYVTGRDAKLAEFEAEKAQRTADTQAEGEKTIAEARQGIDDKKAETKEAQAKAKDETMAKVRQDRAKTLAQIDAKVAETDAQVTSAFEKAEKDAAKEKADGERRAAQKKREEAAKSNDDSWLSRGARFLSSCVDALASVVDSIIEGVKAAVTKIIDAAKKLANDLIDSAVGFINSAIDQFGKLAKGAIQGLVGGVMPELADKMCGWVDSKVESAKAAVTQMGEDLKKGINELLDGLKNAVNQLLDVYNGLLQTGLAVAKGVMTGDFSDALIKALEAGLAIAGVSKDQFYGFVGKAESTLEVIVNNPGGFIGNCISAVSTGFGQFGENFLDHLQVGMVNWLTGQVGDTGIEMPETLDVGGVLDIALQVMGLTPDKLREKAVEHLGEDAVDSIQFVWGFIESAIQGGLSGLWEHIETYVGDLWGMVIGQIQDWLMGEIVEAAAKHVAALFVPFGALAKALMTAWDLYTWVQDKAQEMSDLLTAVVDGINDIATGNIGPASNMIESTLAGFLPMAIDLLANLVGVGGIGEEVRKIIEGVQESVDQALDSLIDKVKGQFTPTETTGESANEKETEPEGDPAEGVFDLPHPPKQLFKDETGEDHELWVEGPDDAMVLMVASEPAEVVRDAAALDGHLGSLEESDRAAVLALETQVLEKLREKVRQENLANRRGIQPEEKSAAESAARTAQDEAIALSLQIVAKFSGASGVDYETQVRALMGTFKDVDKVIEYLPEEYKTMGADELATQITSGTARKDAWAAWVSAKQVDGAAAEMATIYGDQTAQRKLVEVTNDTAAEDSVKVGFYSKLNTEITESLQRMVDPISVYTEMKHAAAPFAKKGKEVKVIGDVWRVAGLSGLWNYNVLDEYKDKVFRDKVVPAAPDVPWSSLSLDKSQKHALALEYFKSVSDWPLGTPSGFAGKLSGSNDTMWWTDDTYGEALQAGDTSGDRLEEFNEMCRLGALQPSWYTGGLVRFSMDADNLELRKPTVYDGMMSELWVQSDNIELWGVTGGGVREWVSGPADGKNVNHWSFHPTGNSFDKWITDLESGSSFDQNERHEVDAAFAEAAQQRGNEDLMQGEAAPPTTDPGLQQAHDVNQNMADPTRQRQQNSIENGGNLDPSLDATSPSDHISAKTPPPPPPPGAGGVSPGGGPPPTGGSSTTGPASTPPATTPTTTPAITSEAPTTAEAESTAPAVEPPESAEEETPETEDDKGRARIIAAVPKSVAAAADARAPKIKDAWTKYITAKPFKKKDAPEDDAGITLDAGSALGNMYAVGKAYLSTHATGENIWNTYFQADPKRSEWSADAKATHLTTKTFTDWLLVNKAGGGFRSGFQTAMGDDAAAKLKANALSVIEDDPAELKQAAGNIKYSQESGHYGDFNLPDPELKEHRRYKPVNVTGSMEDGKITYEYENSDAKFEVSFGEQTVGKSKMINQIKGERLKIKDVAGRGFTSVDGNRRTLNNDLNSSHLIADQLMGSGYRASHNLVTTSDVFNQVVMKEREDLMVKKLIQVYAQNPEATFDLTVNVKWEEAPLTKQEINWEEIAKNPGLQKHIFDRNPNITQKSLIDYIKGEFNSWKTDIDENMCRVEDVIYELTVDGKLIEGIEPTGPDVYLGVTNMKAGKK